MKNKAGTIIEISQPFPDLPAVQGFQPATWPEVWPDHKSDMLSHILWSVCLIRWRLTLPFSINVPFYFKWGLFLKKKKNLFRGGNYHVKPVCKSFCWDLLLRIRRACFSFTGISVELMALLMLLSWKRSRERLLEPERLDSPPTQTSLPFAGLTIDITNIMHCTLTGKQNKW